MLTQQLHLNDHQLVQLYVNGNEQALATLLSRHKGRIYGYIMMMVHDRQLAEDLFQDTFFKVIATLKKGAYHEDGKFLPWVLRIAHNLIIDHFRKGKQMRFIAPRVNNDGEEIDLFSTLLTGHENKEEKLVKNQMQKALRKFIEQLPEEQREVLMMRHYYDMSFKEIAEMTNSSLNTALGRMRYALKNLRKMMKEKDIAIEV